MSDDVEAVERRVAALESAVDRLRGAESAVDATEILRTMAEEAAALASEVERTRRLIADSGG